MPVSVDKLNRTFLKIRDKRSALKREFDEQDKVLSVQQDRIKAALLKYCKEEGLETVKTESGTAVRSVRTKYWTSDWASMYDFVMENGVPEFFTKSLNQSNVKQFLEDNPDKMPPGLNVESEYVISVRKPKGK